MLAVIWLVALLAMPGKRTVWLVFTVLTIAIDALLLSWSNPGVGATWAAGPLVLGLDGALAGAVGGLRLSAIVVLNVAFFATVGVAAWLDGLRLPRTATLWLGALLIAAQDVGRDARRLMEARRMTGAWPEKRGRQILAAAGLVAPMMVAGVDRARRRRDALQLAGFAPSRLFVPIVAVTALALAGRLALIAIPNISLTYVIVFAGGIAFGPLVGLAAGALSMGMSDVILSGFTPTAFVNVPAMAVVGLIGGLLRRGAFLAQPGRVPLAALGILMTFAFSVLADATEWLLIPEFRSEPGFLVARIAGGLAFNVIPALTNGVLFAVVVPSVQIAFRQPVPTGHPQSPMAATAPPE